jgi:hypothetical protein
MGAHRSGKGDGEGEEGQGGGLGRGQLGVEAPMEGICMEEAPWLKLSVESLFCCCFVRKRGSGCACVREKGNREEGEEQKKRKRRKRKKNMENFQKIKYNL